MQGASGGAGKDDSVEVSSDDAAFAGIASGIATYALTVKRLCQPLIMKPSIMAAFFQICAGN